jgi:four helix bundle protein
VKCFLLGLGHEQTSQKAQCLERRCRFSSTDIWVTERFPSNEQFGLTSQIRRAAVSIPSNIAEGAARQTRKEFIQFLHVSKGSLSELDTQLELAKRLEYLGQAEWEALNVLLERVDRMLSGLIRHLKTKR